MGLSTTTTHSERTPPTRILCWSSTTTSLKKGTEIKFAQMDLDILELDTGLVFFNLALML